MLIERLIKILVSGALAVLCALIAIGNIQDPASNMAFVQHVLSMDYLPADSQLAERALPIPLLWQVVFWVIVAMEAVTAALFAFGTLELVRALNSNAWDFQAAKRFIYLGAGCGFLVWFVGFTGFRRRMVRHVAVSGMERSAGRVSPRRVHLPCPDLRRPTGCRALIRVRPRRSIRAENWR